MGQLQELWKKSLRCCVILSPACSARLRLLAAGRAPACDISKPAPAGNRSVVVVNVHMRAPAQGDALLEAFATRSVAAALGLVLQLPCQVSAEGGLRAATRSQ